MVPSIAEPRIARALARPVASAPRLLVAFAVIGSGTWAAAGADHAIVGALLFAIVGLLAAGVADLALRGPSGGRDLLLLGAFATAAGSALAFLPGLLLGPDSPATFFLAALSAIPAGLVVSALPASLVGATRAYAGSRAVDDQDRAIARAGLWLVTVTLAPLAVALPGPGCDVARIAPVVAPAALLGAATWLVASRRAAARAAFVDRVRRGEVPGLAVRDREPRDGDQLPQLLPGRLALVSTAAAPKPHDAPYRGQPHDTIAFVGDPHAEPARPMARWLLVPVAATVASFEALGGDRLTHLETVAMTAEGASIEPEVYGARPAGCLTQTPPRSRLTPDGPFERATGPFGRFLFPASRARGHASFDVEVRVTNLLGRTRTRRLAVDVRRALSDARRLYLFEGQAWADLEVVDGTPRLRFWETSDGAAQVGYSVDGGPNVTLPPGVKVVTLPTRPAGFTITIRTIDGSVAEQRVTPEPGNEWRRAQSELVRTR